MALLAVTLAACTGLVAPLPTQAPTPLPSVTPNTPDVEGTAATFLDAWHRGDFAGMYSLLSPLSQAATSKADFTARYQELVTGASLT
jgi:hypothetical protein